MNFLELIGRIPSFWKNWWEMIFTGATAPLHIYLAMGVTAIILIIILIVYLRKRKQ